ncbi:alpha/beta hydrolase [Chitinophagaceae bacterium LB-8]|uniref:Alpha/beta hydrolase n=1 Tax=Paraflavisolibacter caeni TaxID=2982496 RepID=A0A9X2XSV5_9BACT|nr:alpha/beta hydrolase [Paraflavisolibacter caeni]MCU7547651.1 alpha/beta hydrolase [Paraflavisolibacter caeni]
MKRCLAILFAGLFLGISTFAQLRPLGLELENFSYPFPVHYIHLHIQKQNLKMAYMDVQPAQPNGQTVLLFHGKNFSGAYWDSTAKALLANGYRVIMPDQIGFGKSSKPAMLQYSFALLADNTKKLLDSLQVRKVNVLGHSMGGMLAVRFTLMFPDMVEKLILENPIGLEDYKTKVPYQSVDMVYQGELKQSFEKIKAYQTENYYGGNWKPQYEKWVNMLAGWTLNPQYPIIAWNAALTTDMIINQPVVYELDRITAPTLLIIGQRDRTALGKNLVSEEVRKTMGNYPELGKKTHERIKNSRLVEIDHIGHLPHIENFSAFIKPLLDFLKQS